MQFTMTFRAYIPIQTIYICTVVHTLCIWGHKYSMYTNVPENLTFVCPRYKYKYLNIKAGEGVRG